MVETMRIPPPHDIPTDRSCYHWNETINASPPRLDCMPNTMQWSLDFCDTFVAACIMRMEDPQSYDESLEWFRDNTIEPGQMELVSAHPTRVDMPREARLQTAEDQNREVCVYAVGWTMLDENGCVVGVMGNKQDHLHHENIIGWPMVMTEETLASLGNLPEGTFELGGLYFVFGRKTARKVPAWLFSQIAFCGEGRE